MKVLRKLLYFCSLCILSTGIFPNQASALCDTGTCYITGDGSGDFNCDGADDHVQLQQAFDYAASHSGTTLYLKGPFVYNVDPNKMYIGSHITITGNSTAVVRLKKQDPNFPTPSLTRAIFQANSSSIQDITFHGFEIDGNILNSWSVSGNDHINMIQLIGSSDVTVYDMSFKNGLGDAIKVRHGGTDNYVHENTNIQIYNNRIDKIGHDAIYLMNVSNISVYNNFISCRDDSGVRLFNCKDVAVFNNEVTSENHGGAGIEIQKNSAVTINNINIYNNNIYNIRLQGIWLLGYGSYSLNAASGVSIHHNLIRNSGDGGIVIQGFNNTIIENNVIIGNNREGIVLTDRSSYGGSAPGSGYVTTVRNNIITGNQNGVSNLLSSTHSFIFQNNDVWNNSSGNYSGVSAGSSDISSDPLFASSTDYHLKSQAGRWDGSAWVTDTVSSPCIDTGYAPSSYANEPQNNGGRINIGRYGNTTAASLSGTSPQSQMPSDPAADSFPVSDASSEDSLNTSTPSTPDTSYYNPTESILNSNPVQDTNPALAAIEKKLNPWWYGLSSLWKKDSDEETKTISIDFSNPLNTSDPIVLAQNIIHWFLVVSGAVGLLSVIIGGIVYTSSTGDQQKAQQGKTSSIFHNRINYHISFLFFPCGD